MQYAASVAVCLSVIYTGVFVVSVSFFTHRISSDTLYYHRIHLGTHGKLLQNRSIRL